MASLNSSNVYAWRRMRAVLRANTRASQSAWKARPSSVGSTGPNPSMPPTSWILVTRPRYQCAWRPARWSVLLTPRSILDMEWAGKHTDPVVESLNQPDGPVVRRPNNWSLWLLLIPFVATLAPPFYNRLNLTTVYTLRRPRSGPGENRTGQA